MATLASLRAWAEASGKTAVEVGRDVPGFIVNRLQYALLREAFALIESGVCEYSDVDAVMKTRARRTMGDNSGRSKASI